MSDGDRLEAIGDVASTIPPVAPNQRCDEIDRIFAASPDLGALAVVDRGRPVGLINRYDMITQLSRDYGRALYARKPVTTLMDRAPLIVEHNLGLDRLETLIADEHPSALLRGFIVTRNGAYHGVGTALSLLHLSRVRTERRNRSLEKAHQAAEAASQSKTRFLANMSHELRTPLNAVIGFAEVMHEELHGPLNNPRYAGYVQDILTSGQHLLGLINNILDMARIESGAWTIHPVITDPLEAMEHCLRIFRNRAEQQGLVIVTRFDPALEEGHADPQALRHMMLNLMSNAVKFTPRGGRVELGTEKLSDGGFRLWVTDNGIGIAPEHIPLVLSPFGQVENDLTRKYDGTGLGLPLVKALVELHGGNLEILGLPNQGTTARLSFPPPPRAIDIPPQIRVSSPA
ncbi:HAMP domain-containing sensor histidine kinase [Ferrovibrio sp.]|uniref:sensor histidine kinase n=1 Tax=Ferrovibrio sp. TaxID=1917215 RepID=UPI0025BEA064|nr:HAMP domain-containing sensor histidine kinase [Ferrovibrio sp.]MBX3455201.1 HAMP domain-containing histidine kinase [Ferrovibrio sp.]